MKIWSDQTASDKFAATVAKLNGEVGKMLNLSASTQLTMERMRKLRLANDKAEARNKRAGDRWEALHFQIEPMHRS